METESGTAELASVSLSDRSTTSEWALEYDVADAGEWREMASTGDSGITPPMHGGSPSSCVDQSGAPRSGRDKISFVKPA